VVQTVGGVGALWQTHRLESKIHSVWVVQDIRGLGALWQTQRLGKISCGVCIHTWGFEGMRGGGSGCCVDTCRVLGKDLFQQSVQGGIRWWWGRTGGWCRLVPGRLVGGGGSLHVGLLGVLYRLGRLYLLLGWLLLLGGSVSAPVYTSLVSFVALLMWVACW
jgi:hypothetical protein